MNSAGYERDLERIACEDDEEDENLYPSDPQRVIADEARYTDICSLCDMVPCCTILYDNIIIDIISTCNRTYPKKDDGHLCHDMALKMSMNHFSEIPVCVMNVFNEEWGS